MESINLVTIKLVKEGEIPFEQFKVALTGPERVVDAVVDVVHRLIGDKDKEYLLAIQLNDEKIITSVNVVSIGSLSELVVNPREIFKAAILGNASSIILAHNHPSGNINPSKEDINITKRVTRAGDILGITLLDHIIINDSAEYYSFEEQALIFSFKE